MMTNKHSKLSPSSAHRWMACPGSVRLEAQFPDESSPYAKEGTTAHELVESMMRGEHVVRELYDPVMYSAAEAFVKYVYED